MTIQTDSDQRLLHTAQASVGLRPYYVYVPSTVGPRMVLDPEIPVIVCSQDAIRVGEHVMAATYGPPKL